jgi:phosphoheptose isomerase
MGEAEDLLKDALESNKAKELLFRREAEAISRAATLIAKALGAGRTVYVIGGSELSLLGRYLAHAFFAGETGASLRAIALGGDGTATALSGADHPIVRETRAFVDKGDILVALGRDGAPGALFLALDAARAKGATTIALAGYPGEELQEHADAVIIVPSRRPSVVAETVLAIGHLLARLVARRLGLDTATTTGSDPFESSRPEKGASLSSSSAEVVVAELVEAAPPPSLANSEARKRMHGSSVELVPLYMDEKNAEPQRPNTVRFRCASCRETITVDAKFAGRTGQCPNCLADFKIPRPDEPGLETAASPGPAAARPVASPAASASGRRAGNPAASSGARRQEVAPRPTEDRQEERRRAGRVNVTDAVVCFGRERFPDDEDQPQARYGLENLSLTGVSIVVKAPTKPLPANMPALQPTDVKIGEPVYLLLDFPAFVDRIRVQGEVRRVSPFKTAAGSGFTIGVRFSRFLDDAQAKVRRLVENGALRGVRRR